MIHLMVAEPENLVLQLLRDLRGDMDSTRTELRSEVAGVASEVRSLRADVAADLASVEKRLNEQFAGLRRAVVEYHSSAIGHGVLFSELEERVRRLEQHLNLGGDAH